MEISNVHTKLAQNVADQFKDLSQVEAIAVSGSLSSGSIDDLSDIDLYIYIHDEIPVEIRRRTIDSIGHSRAEFNNQYWDTGDEWIEKETGITIDMMYWGCGWIEEQVNRTLKRHEAWVGYTTGHWHTVRNSRILYDKSNWFKNLQEKCLQSYPQPLQENIIAKNFPLLTKAIPAYTNQVKKAIKRNDRVAVNHRITSFLASYFDVIFALNKIPHPGEKRMIQNIKSTCSKLPDKAGEDVVHLLSCSATINEEIVNIMNQMTEKLTMLLLKEKLITAS